MWVRSNPEARKVIVELVFHLIVESAPHYTFRRFPLGDSIGQPGPDGELETPISFGQFVPEGRSFWEIGTGKNARVKATSDYKERTDTTPKEVRQQATFIFVTPLSASTDWQYTWKKDDQARWIDERRKRNDWRDVRVIDGTLLIDWLQYFPAIEQGLAILMGKPAQQMQIPEQRWALLQAIGEPPPLTPHIFLANRDDACARLKELFSGTKSRLRLDTRFPNQTADFVAGFIASMDDDAKVDMVGHCLIIKSPEAWKAVAALRDPHIMVADFDLDEEGPTSLAMAQKGHHTVIFGGTPGGLPDPNRVPLRNPQSDQIKEALIKAGYGDERARMLAQKSGGDLNSLLGLLQSLSGMPEWREGTAAADLAIAEILGSWNDQSKGDRSVIEKISGNSYGEWIGKMREVALRPGTPLIQRDSVWKFIARYEGWYAFGPRIYDDILDRLKEAAVVVLREIDPKFEMLPEDRFTANIHGKVPLHSHALRKGLAESLALLGSHSNALTFCSSGKALNTSALAVREILENSDWMLWASLNDLTPFLAEADPREFLAALENALNRDPCPFDTIFSQERSGYMGATYMSGILWALEMLAWDQEYLVRVVIILGELAERDPGGNWVNRPINSLNTIFLPWLPQTCASVVKRKTAIETLILENPEVAWNLLISLLPNSQQTSSGSYKPSWREMITDDCIKPVNRLEYWEQTAIFAELAISMAKKDLAKLSNLIDHLNDLPPSACEQLLTYLSSDEITSRPESDKLRLWNKIIDLVKNHRKYAGAKWAMTPEQVDKIAYVADLLAPRAPMFSHQRLFSGRLFDLSEWGDTSDEQIKKLDEARQRAVNEIFGIGGVQAVLDFAKEVDSPSLVGFAVGMVGKDEIDQDVLPNLLEMDKKSLVQFAGGFVQGRFHKRGWQWIDQIEISKWHPSQIGQFLAYLPFTSKTWERVSSFLKGDESSYWSRANATPYEIDKDLDFAIEQLILYDRPFTAINCLYGMRLQKQPLNNTLTVRALLKAVKSAEITSTMGNYAIVELIKALQNDAKMDPDDLYMIEGAYLPLLDFVGQGTSPRFLEQRLADDPTFFCEVIRLVFRSKKEDRPVEKLTEQQKNIARNAYRLLHNWRIPPGTLKDGTFNSDTWIAWFDAVKKECTETGRLEVAMTNVGQVLIHTPHDPDGFWINHAVAESLDAKNANDMREGFTIALFNSRGAHFVSKGEEEKDLAAKYRKIAEELESHHYHRLAYSLRNLAVTYERDAEQLAKENLMDNLIG
jgi:hypothetical protein